MADNNTPTTSAEVSQLLSEMLTKIFTENYTIKDLQGLSDAEIESVYALGYNYYRSGNYADSEKIFHYLCLVDHLEIKYWIALGATEQMQKNYAGAVKAYAYASMLDLHDPRPQLHAAECFLAMKDKENAASSLCALLEFCPDTPEKKKYRDRATALQKLLDNAK